MKPSESEHTFIHQVRQTMDQAPLDAATTQRLNIMRQQALAQTGHHRLGFYAIPMAAFASITAVALAATLWLNKPQPSLTVDNIDAFEIISSNDDLELYQNLEFYLWLNEQSDAEIG